jgi:hypothetical protein
MDKTALTLSQGLGSVRTLVLMRIVYVSATSHPGPNSCLTRGILGGINSPRTLSGSLSQSGDGVRCKLRRT